MGGRITVCSEGVGHGTTMSVLIPACFDLDVKLASLHSSKDAPLMADDGTVGSGAIIPQAPKRVLLVDDTVVNLMLMRRMLESLGITVITATSGEDAITRCADSGPLDGIFMDVYMPG
jgi:PleD family two-component response regulator